MSAIRSPQPSSPSSPSSFTVIGGGVIGISVALTLQREGHRVTVLEQAGPGEGCSFGNAGCVSTASVIPMAMPGMLAKVPAWLSDPMGPLTVRWRYLPRAMPWLMRWLLAATEARARHTSRALHALHQETWPGYRALLGPAQFDDLMQAAGHLYVWRAAELGAGDRLAQQMRDDLGIASQALSGDQARELEPALSQGIRTALLLPENGHTCNPERLVKTLAAAFVREGGVLLRRKVLGFDIGAQGPRTVYTDCGSYPVSRLAICAGAWSMRVARGLTGMAVPLETERGYHAMLRAPGVAPTRPIMDCENKFIATPMEHGLRIAGTVEIGGLDAPANFRRAALLAEQGRQLFPGLTYEDASHWMGYRPSTPDGLPVIDRSDRFSNVFLAFGHGHLGITEAPGTARLLADLVADRAPCIDPAPFAMTRFARGGGAAQRGVAAPDAAQASAVAKDARRSAASSR
ncbi:FAD-binding oxidoreductase [Cupriavidus sp. AU9028]|uniref:NAD(P)/FAD-dependent oxidoreductase n=1 Tax=Cupriavidus sp. AU9028 TaxID=2871157 RepID=UPI001C9597F0|nr:FAD-dependent oxidoreductase [Cupriavidus sp. AU9028]MBY4895958.1 FAD-dependent oxidoreductase [Cupriavidus sp. AU9028]